uniref:Uncharacterized protein n=1 Tax=Solanum lycopersicum TaxID=4081 RepID=A0A3Q7ETD4_SOLLC|nr:uncharacterized protein LOC101258295 [Solanum lycopersicum]
MSPKYGSGNRNHSRTDAVVTKSETESNSPVASLRDSNQESKSRKSSDSILNDSVSGSSKSSELSYSTFSSSSGYSSDDFILMNPKIASNSISSNVTSKPLSRVDYNHLKLNTSTSSTSQVSDVTDESLLPTVSITRSPFIQVMDRQGGYDPNRVPSSIFESKSSTPNEWSAVSEESLFSINVSLSRKSAELRMCVESETCEEISKSGKLISRHSSPVKGGERTEKSSVFDTERGVIDRSNLIEAGNQHKSIKKQSHFEEEIKLRGNRDYSSAISHSEGNGGFKDSYNHCNGNDTSLPFPTDRKSTEPLFYPAYYKKKKSRWSSCFSSCFSCGPCCSGCPSCSCKCSSCFSCKWPSLKCCSCKWPTWKCCSCKWPSWKCCSCKWPSWKCCSCKWSSWTCCSCKWLSCSCYCRKWSRKQSCCCK